MNQGSNFLGGSFSSRDNIGAPIQSRRKSTLSILNMCASTPLKNTAVLFLTKPPVNQQTVEAPPFLGNSPHILVFGDPPSKSQIFQ